eukprot:347668-Rhodomonas_salina.2
MFTGLRKQLGEYDTPAPFAMPTAASVMAQFHQVHGGVLTGHVSPLAERLHLRVEGPGLLLPTDRACNFPNGHAVISCAGCRNFVWPVAFPAPLSDAPLMLGQLGVCTVVYFNRAATTVWMGSSVCLRSNSS